MGGRSLIGVMHGFARVALLWLLMCMAPVQAAPAARAAPVAPFSVQDDQGTVHRFAQPPQRVVSMLPSLTEIAWVLGVGPRLVGVDRYSNWPAEVRALPHLGGLDDAQIEAIAALKPDVILAATSSRAMERLSALGFAVVRMRSDTHADVRRSMVVVAQLLGTPQRAEPAWAHLQQQIDAAAHRVPAHVRGQRVYFEVGGGAYAAGSSSFIGETLARLGMGNVVPEALGPFPKLNPEFVVRAKPDWIMGVRRELRVLRERPGWGALPAIRHQRLCGFDAEQYDVLVRPGPRLGEAAALIADCLAAPRGAVSHAASSLGAASR